MNSSTAPLISIITITYNAAATLGRTMSSVAAQTYHDYEHLIIDGASTDRTLDIARQNPTARILSEKDKGLYDAMNKGLRMAKGKYVLFLNSGDTFRDTSILGRYAERAEAGDDIIYADTMIVDSGGHDIKPRHYSAPAILDFNSFHKGMLVCHQAFMVRRELAPEYDLQYRFSADYDWTIKCIKASDPKCNTNLNLYAINYLNDGLTDNNKMRSLRERYRIMASHYGHISAITRHLSLIASKLV